jgi:mannose-6-phosphate isomerase
LTFEGIYDRIITDFQQTRRLLFILNLPLRLVPAFKDYLWGGTKLLTEFGKKCSYDTLAESWELSCHPDGLSKIEGTDKTLNDFIAENGISVLGTNCRKFNELPVLVKLIDAKDDLSVQVHPDDEFARKHENGNGKTEMWYVIDCEEGASLLYGFKNRITKEEFRRRIESNTLLEEVNRVPVKKGDVFFIRSGTLHAIGRGILIAEIQQNSNTTYRIYDYGRKDKNGCERELHIDKACEVTKLCPAEPYPEHQKEQKNGFTSKLLSSCDFFTVHLLETSGTAELETDSTSFEHMLITEGSGRLVKEGHSMDLAKGDSIFIPAGYGSYSIEGHCLIIKTRIDQITEENLK